jgi:hypothetical protein
VIDQSDEIIRQDFDIVANCTGGCPIAGLLNLLSDDSQSLLEKHIGIALNDELSVIRGPDATLALRGFTPHIICRRWQVLFMDPASPTSVALAD